MVYNWINVVIGILTIVIPIVRGLKGLNLWIHIIGGAIIAICAYIANQQAKK
ncbi:MAG: hypothetical protein N2380_00225 [bacterium]|nr:hypothetical protein [bacterium]